MNLDQIRYFVTVAQLENVSRAAEVYHLSQSSISKNIAKLEEEIGVELFTRKGKKLELNSAGERFLESSNKILREADRALSDIRMLTSGEDLTIKIGFAGRINSLMDHMRTFREQHPSVQFDLKSNIENVQHLDINDFDVLIYPDDPRYARFSGFAVGEEKYWLAVSANSDLAHSAVASPALMQGQNFVFLKRDNNFIEFPYKICTSLAIKMPFQSFVDSRGAHRRMIAGGMAVGFVPEGEVNAYSLERQIRLLPILDKRFSRRMMICFKREKHLSDTARAFRDYLSDELGIPV